MYTQYNSDQNQRPFVIFSEYSLVMPKSISFFRKESYLLVSERNYVQREIGKDPTKWLEISELDPFRFGKDMTERKMPVKNMCELVHTWILIFGIAIPYLRPDKATNWNFLVPSGLFVTCWSIQISALLPSLLPNTTVGREESPNMWNSFLGQVIIFFSMGY